jgi:hypothetical protein
MKDESDKRFLGLCSSGGERERERESTISQPAIQPTFQHHTQPTPVRSVPVRPTPAEGKGVRTTNGYYCSL